VTLALRKVDVLKEAPQLDGDDALEQELWVHFWWGLVYCQTEEKCCMLYS
jgi:hypothetical protein